MNRKRILKAAFSDIIPQKLQDRPKKGFGVPIAKWLRTDWNKIAEDALFGSTLCSENYINKTQLERIWNCHCKGRADWSYLLWSLLVLAVFLENERSDAK